MRIWLESRPCFDSAHLNLFTKLLTFSLSPFQAKGIEQIYLLRQNYSENLDHFKKQGIHNNPQLYFDELKVQKRSLFLAVLGL